MYKVGPSLPALLSTVALLACSDLTGTPPAHVAPADAPRMSWDGTTIPSFNTIEEGQAYMGAAKVHRVVAAVTWNGELATTAAAMWYRGTDAEIVATLSGGGPSGSFSTESRQRKESGGLNAEFWISGPRYAVGGTCGHFANVTTENIARIRVPVPWELQELSIDMMPGHDSKNQGACPTATAEVVENWAPGGGCDGYTCEDNYAYCVVEYTYYVDTGAIISSRTLYCY